MLGGMLLQSEDYHARGLDKVLNRYSDIFRQCDHPNDPCCAIYGTAFDTFPLAMKALGLEAGFRAHTRSSARGRHMTHCTSPPTDRHAGFRRRRGRLPRSIRHLLAPVRYLILKVAVEKPALPHVNHLCSVSPQEKPPNGHIARTAGRRSQRSHSNGASFHPAWCPPCGTERRHVSQKTGPRRCQSTRPVDVHSKCWEKRKTCVGAVSAGVDRTPTHNTHLCSTVCSQARKAHHALGSRPTRLKSHGLLCHLCAPEKNLIWCRTCLKRC